MNFLPAEMREDAKMRPSRTGYIGWCATIKYGIGRGTEAREYKRLSNFENRQFVKLSIVSDGHI